MKKSGLILFILFIIINYNYAQLYTATIGKAKAKPGDTITIPLNVTGFNDIGAIGFYIKIDTTVLTNLQNDSSCTANIHNAISNYFMSHFDKKDSTGPTLKIGYTNYGTQGVNIGDAKLCDLKFIYKGGTAALCFDTAYSGVSDFTTLENVNVIYTCGEASIAEGVKEITDDKSTKIYPNPSNGYITLSLNSISNIKQISVYSLNGEKVYNKEVNMENSDKLSQSLYSRTYNLDLANLKKGMYLLKILSKDDVIFTKLILQ